MGHAEVESAVNTAKILSGLDSCTMWALIASAMMAYVWWSRKKEFESNEAWRGIREKQIASETAQTQVLNRLIDEVAGMKLLLTKYLIKE